MITVIIETRDDEVALAHALAALVPAATEGIVREVIVVDHGSSDGTLVVADVAGCAIVRAVGQTTDARDSAASNARGDWLLFLLPNATLPAGWQTEALAFIDRALVSGAARTRSATLRRGRIATGLWSSVSARFRVADGELVSKSRYLAARATSSLPASAASSASGVRRGAA